MIWPVYASLLALLFFGLSVRTLRLRRRLRVAVGDGGHPLLLRAMRVHANCAEYVPLGLLLIAGAENVGAAPLLVHSLGVALLVGRSLHAFGVSHEREVFAFRVSGMLLTFTCYLGASLFILSQRLTSLG